MCLCFLISFLIKVCLIKLLVETGNQIHIVNASKGNLEVHEEIGLA